MSGTKRLNTRVRKCGSVAIVKHTIVEVSSHIFILLHARSIGDVVRPMFIHVCKAGIVRQHTITGHFSRIVILVVDSHAILGNGELLPALALSNGVTNCLGERLPSKIGHEFFLVRSNMLHWGIGTGSLIAVGFLQEWKYKHSNGALGCLHV